MANIVIMGVGLIVAVLYCFAATQIPTTAGDPIGPRTFPYLISLGLLLSLGWMAVEQFVKRRLAQQADEAALVQWPKLHVIGTVILGTAVYYALIEPLGFPLSTSLYLFALSSLLDSRRLVLNAVVAVCFSASLYFLFTLVLKSNLPIGAIFS